ncbi:MAG: tetratricopeptide repeat protein [Candidatus Paceibacterota bacterium]
MASSVSKLHEQAIEAALSKDWKRAIMLNDQILKHNSDNLDANLGLGFVYLQKGDLKQSTKYYKKALKLDPTSIIAEKNLEKIKTIEKHGQKKSKLANQEIILDPNTFINIAGKTKLATLTNIGQADVIAALSPGERVYLRIKKRRVEVRNSAKEYIGALPDDLSKRLIFFLQAKSSYLVYINSASKNSVEVFIKEEKKNRRVAQFISFPKNIRDDLKTIIGQIEEQDAKGTSSNDSSEKDDEDEEDGSSSERPVDIEELAENLETQKEQYISGINQDDSDEFEE